MKRLLLAVGFVLAAGWVVGAGAQEKAGGAGKEEQANNRSRVEKVRRQKAPKVFNRFVTTGNQALVSYKDRLEFFKLAPGTSLNARGHFAEGGSEKNPSEVEPVKIIWLSRPATLISRPNAPNILICSAVWLPKLASGGLDNFCGIISLQGEVVYKFPFEQHAPNQVLHPLAINDAGTYAEVYVSSLVHGEEGVDVGGPKEILAWRSPDKFSRFPGPWKDGRPKDAQGSFDQLLQGFKVRQKK